MDITIRRLAVWSGMYLLASGVLSRLIVSSYSIVFWGILSSVNNLGSSLGWFGIGRVTWKIWFPRVGPEDRQRTRHMDCLVPGNIGFRFTNRGFATAELVYGLFDSFSGRWIRSISYHED